MANSTTNNRLTSGGEVFMNNKPVVRVAALSGVKRPLIPVIPAVSTPTTQSTQQYQMIQIGDEMFKVASLASTAQTTTVCDITKQTLTDTSTFDNRNFYSEMPDGAPTTLVISKTEKDNSNDGYSSDEASDLSLQLEDARCHNATTAGLTAIVQGPDGQFFVPVRTLGSSVNNNILLSGDFTTADLDDSSRKRELRLLKNREAAKECRRKKKDYVRCLENRVALLENQNKTLINELKSLKELYCQKETQS